MHITFEDLRRLCPRGDAGIIAEIVRLAPELLPRYGITTPRRWCHLVAQLAHESQGFTRLTENLNYSAEGLRKTFGKYFTPAEAAAYARQPERIASRAYANRMGNGPESTGDGWRYRGRGLIMNTGKAGYARVGAVLGMDLVAAPERLEDPAVAFEAALVFWRDRRINQHADVDDTGMVTTIINGGLNGYDDRVRLLQLCFAIWGRGASSSLANGVRPTLRRGDAGEAVRIMQQALNTPTVMREIDLRVFVDGQFGAGTEAALKAWQRTAGLTPDGVCGPATWASLDNLAQPVPDAAPPPQSKPKPPRPVDAPDEAEPEPAPQGGFFHALSSLWKGLTR